VPDQFFHVVYLRSGRVLLSRKCYGTWREIQDEYSDYMTSLGPWPVSDIVQFLKDKYPAAFPSKRPSESSGSPCQAPTR
jgi:hypothetical protein